MVVSLNSRLESNRGEEEEVALRRDGYVDDSPCAVVRLRAFRVEG